MLGLLLPTDDKERIVGRERHDFDAGRHVVINDAYQTDVRHVPRLYLSIFRTCHHSSINKHNILARGCFSK